MAGSLLKAYFEEEGSTLVEDWERSLRFEASEALLRAAASVADRYRLRAYDAVHLASARMLRDHGGGPISFASWDHELDAAAARDGFLLLRQRCRQAQSGGRRRQTGRAVSSQGCRSYGLGRGSTKGYHANWELFRCDCGDLLVRSELSAPDAVNRGETLLLQGRAVLSRGFGEHQDELGSSLDAPALMMQLALRLLERSEPGGPARVTAPVDVDVLDEINQIHLESYSAVGGFHAPWSVQGSIAPVSIAPPGADQRRFDLRFAFTVGAGSEAQQGPMRLQGVADFAHGDFPLPGSGSLDGWALSWRDEQDPAIPTSTSMASSRN